MKEYIINNLGELLVFTDYQKACDKFEKLVKKYVKDGFYLMKTDDGYLVGDLPLTRNFGVFGA